MLLPIGTQRVLASRWGKKSLKAVKQCCEGRGGLWAAGTAGIYSLVELLRMDCTARASGSGAVWPWTRFPVCSCVAEVVRGCLCQPHAMFGGHHASENVSWKSARVPLHHGLLHLEHFELAGGLDQLWSNYREHGNWAYSKDRGIQKRALTCHQSICKLAGGSFFLHWVRRKLEDFPRQE